MKKKLISLLENSIEACCRKGIFDTGKIPSVEVEMTRDISHGDFASNVAMAFASAVRKNPRKVAGAIVENIVDAENILDKTEIAGPGFINFFIKDSKWVSLLEEVDSLKKDYGKSDIGRGGNVIVEFVSANPTGPLHIGHARGAVVGDVIANILESMGYSVFREYYINDAGNQMKLLGRSVFYRYLELAGRKVDFPPECYQGEYIGHLAGDMVEKYGDKYLEMDEDEAVEIFTGYASNLILDGIKEDLKAFGIEFDNYFRETDLYKNGSVTRLLSELQRDGYIYEDGAALWFRATDYGDEKDRVVVRENGEPTYFASDIAYHKNKHSRGFDMFIDVWGADHHGYIPRMYAALNALGIEKDALKIVLVQLVNLLRGGKPVAMSTRAGEFVTMKKVVEEVGRDAARYNFLMRRSDSHLDFDLELAKKQSSENPVYYVQYMHARISSIMRLAIERGYTIPAFADVDLNLLILPEEIALIKKITAFPEVVESSCRTLEPHRLIYYLNDLASAFHSYYNKYKVVSDAAALTGARLFLVKTVHIVTGNALRLIGVSAPEKM